MMTMKAVPHRPAISNILVKASANASFRSRLLSDPNDVLGEMNLPPEDIKILTGIRASNLREYARQVKTRLVGHQY